MTREMRTLIVRHGLCALSTLADAELAALEPWLTRDMIRAMIGDPALTALADPEREAMVARIDATLARLERPLAHRIAGGGID